MQWRVSGLVWQPSSLYPWASSHAMGPVPVLLDENTIRVYVTVLDRSGVGRPTFVDVLASDPTQVVSVANYPVMDIGQPGDFDDNGLMALSILRADPDRLLLYYAGFELCQKIRYRILTGVAVSHDNGLTFSRIQRTPVLERSPDEAFFRGGPCVMRDGERFRMWYVAGSCWETINGKEMPIYDLRYQESSDGLNWSNRGTTCLAITEPDEHGFGRPWVVKSGKEKYELFYSIRRRSLSAYRLGYATSPDGLSWIRRDDEMGLDVVPGTFASTAIMYSAVLKVREKTYCFYNGDDFGRNGFAVAELIE